MMALAPSRQQSVETLDGRVVEPVGIGPVVGVEARVIANEPLALFRPHAGAGAFPERVVPPHGGLQDRGLDLTHAHDPRGLAAHRLTESDRQRHVVVPRLHVKLDFRLEATGGPAEEPALDILVDRALEERHAFGLPFAEEGFAEVVEIRHDNV